MILNHKVSIRPIAKTDIGHIVKYWFENEEKSLINLGVNIKKLGSSTDLTQSLEKSLNTPISQAKTYYLIWLINDKPIGYSCLRDISHNEIAHMHLHIWNKENRKQGYGARLFALSTIEFYRLFNLKMVLCEPLSSNSAPNKLLKKAGFKLWRTYHCISSEISLLGEVNSYIIDSITAERYLEKLK